jgi:hypothetical protein
MQHPGLALLGVLLVPALPACADDGPVLAPTHDVVVTYQVTGAELQEGAEKLQVTYGEQGRVRMDYFRYAEAKYAFGSMLFDPPNKLATMVLPERRGYLQRVLRNVTNPGAFLNGMMKFTRVGSATIAGMNCTDWRVDDGLDDKGTACVTDDGIVLRGVRTKPSPGSILATAVQYGAVPLEIFAIPPGLTSLSPAKPSPPPRSTPAARSTSPESAVAPPSAAAQPEPEAPSKPEQPVAPKLAGSETAPTPAQPVPPSAPDTALAPPAAPAPAALPPGWSLVGEPKKE